MNGFISFFTGVVAAFTPCVIVLIPLLLYRFFTPEKKKILSFIIFIASFLAAYGIFGIFLQELLTSAVANGFKLGLGLLFITIGILALQKRINPMQIPAAKNPIIFGIIFAIIIAINPCALPYVSLLIASNQGIYLVINILLFGVGLITPAVIIALAGKSVISFTKISGRVYNKISYLMNILLIGSGLYLIFLINSLQSLDIYLVAIFLLFITFVIVKAHYVAKKHITPKAVVFIIAMALTIIAATLHCGNAIQNDPILSSLTPASSQHVCTEGNIFFCPVCGQCMIVFGIVVVLLFTTVFLYMRKEIL